MIFLFVGIQEPRWPRASKTLCTPLWGHDDLIASIEEHELFPIFMTCYRPTCTCWDLRKWIQRASCSDAEYNGAPWKRRALGRASIFLPISLVLSQLRVAVNKNCTYFFPVYSLTLIFASLLL